MREESMRDKRSVRRALYGYLSTSEEFSLLVKVLFKTLGALPTLEELVDAGEGSGINLGKNRTDT